MGETYYFGRKGNWDVILTSEEAIISTSIILLLDLYTQSNKSTAIDKLEEIKTSWFNKYSMDRSYKYYFLKYQEFTSKLNYFVWPNDYEIRMLGTEGSNPLVAYHISPYVLTVCRKINAKNKCDEDQCYLQYSGNSPLVLKNGMKMTSKLEGWLIPKHSLIDSSIISKYSLSSINDEYILNDNTNKDRIEIAIDFINDILKK
jgi:hypothetical protein